MLQSPRWLFLREIFPAFDRGVIHFEKIFKRTGKLTGHTKDYLQGVTVSKLPRNIVYGIFIVFLGYLAAFSIMWRLDNPGVRVTPILTDSMAPTISSGSLIITSPFDNYYVGDVITYQEHHPKTGNPTDRTLTHRIIATKETSSGTVYIAQGDANRIPDINDIQKEHIYGKLLYTIPLVGYLYSFVSTLPGFILLVALPALLLIMNEIKYIRYNRIMDKIRSDNGDVMNSVLMKK